jgi:preprotein translocase SecE subunit
MSRAIRRHPVATKGGRQRPARPPIVRAGPGRRPQREARDGRGLLGLLRPRWAEDIVSELRKVTWPSFEDTRYLTFVVLVVAVAFGIFLGGVDMFFNWAIDNTLLRSP